MTEFEEIEIALRLSRSKGVGAAGFKKLIDEYKLPSIADKVWSEKQTKIDLKKVSLGKNVSEALIDKSIAYIKEKKCKAFYYGQKGYPEQFKILTEAPPVVFMSSDILNKPLVAIVGSRNADEKLLDKAKYYAESFIEKGYGIISGGALGIDNVAHKTALANNAYTIAVLANGIDIVYPLFHEKLFKTIEEKGLLITELMVGAKPYKSFFPTRNRLIAALADIVIAFPASNSKGTFVTINWAKKLGKKVICPLKQK